MNPTTFADRSEWLAWRRDGLGASDIAQVARVSPWGSPWRVWADKTGRAGETAPSEAMERGLLLEDAIIDRYAEREGVEVVHRGAGFTHPTETWIRATPDIIVSDATGHICVDVKTTRDGAWDEPPVHYVTQVQWQLITTGLERGAIAALHGGQKLMVYPIAADFELQQALIRIGREFWETNVLGGVEPPAMASDLSAIDALYPKSTGEVVATDDPEVVVAAARYKAVKAEMKLLESEADACQARIKQALGEAAVLTTSDGRKLATWKTIPRKGYTVEPGEYRRLDVAKEIA